MQTVKDQYRKYDDVYSNFLNKNSSYDNDTNIEGLYEILLFIAESIVFRDDIYTNMDPSLEKSLIIANEIVDLGKEISNREFIHYVVELLKTISNSNENTHIIEHRLILEKKTNKYFFYPIVCRNGGLSIDNISEFIIGFGINSFSRIPLGIALNSRIENGPHDNFFNTPLSFFMHDSVHSGSSINAIQRYDLEKLRTMYSNISDIFIRRVFNFLVWFCLYDESGYNNFYEILNDRNYYISCQDFRYIVNYLKRNSPNDVKNYVIEQDRLVAVHSSKFIQFCLEKLQNYISS